MWNSSSEQLNSLQEEDTIKKANNSGVIIRSYIIIACRYTIVVQWRETDKRRTQGHMLASVRAVALSTNTHRCPLAAL